MTVPDSLKVKAVICGCNHTEIITEDDNLYSFGSNRSGQLGLGDTDNKNVPTLVKVSNGSKVKTVGCGSGHTIIITKDGTLYSFGDNGYGQLGLGDNTPMNIPILVAALNDLKVKVVSCGNNHTVIITEDGNLYSFGKNEFGQLGLGNIGDKNEPKLVTIPGGLKVKAASCGYHHTVIITEDNNFYTFGRNRNIQLGLGDTTNRYIPTLVNIPRATKVIAASCGETHTVVIAK